MPLPITLRPEGRRVLVVGGGNVATRRVHVLLAAGADLTVVSPTASARIVELANEGHLAWHRRGYESHDLDGAWLVQTATDSPVDDLVAADAERARVWCLKGGDPEHATAWMPAVAAVDVKASTMMPSKERCRTTNVATVRRPAMTACTAATVAVSSVNFHGRSRRRHSCPGRSRERQ